MTEDLPPHEIDRLSARASEFIVAGKLSAARPLLAALSTNAAPSARVTVLSAMLAMRRGALDEARIALDAAVTRWPQDVNLRIQRSALHGLQGDRMGALADAAEAVILDPAEPFAKAQLGTALLEVGQAEDARICLAESLAQQPQNTLVRLALSDAQSACGDKEGAHATLYEGVQRDPNDIACRKAAMLMAVQNDQFDAAVQMAEEARRAGVVDAIVYGLAGHALSKLGRHPEATPYYEEARKLGPHDAYVRHLVAAAGGIPSLGAAAPDYVRAVFNTYAPTFDAHLTALGYRVPELLRAALLRHSALEAGEPVGPVLDLGCGTGLMAAALAGLPAGPVVGVDLSPRMLERAGARGAYQALHNAEATAFLAADGATYAAVLAADLFCYLGDLAPVLGLIRARLAEGGICLFSIEELSDAADGRGWELGPEARYRHGADYVRSTAEAAGFQVLELAEEVLRQEANRPVAGLIVACRAQ
jgi:predicted TPR repeat methyltransferase